MNFGFTEEQTHLREEVRRFLDGKCPISEVRRTQETPLGYSEDLWKEMAELGWLGITIPEAFGGSGLTWMDLVVILEETGRSLCPSPFLSNTLAATAILENGSEEQRQRWLPSLVAGSKIGTVALMEESDALGVEAIALRGEADGDDFVLTGEKRLVNDPEAAGLFVVSFRCGDLPGGVGLAVIEADADGLEAKSYPMIDETKRMGNLTLESVRVPGDAVLGGSGKSAGAIERLLEQAATAVSAEMGGTVDQAIQITVQYAKDRAQFGHPIGHFQGVKHPLAEMYTDAESFKSLVYYAAWASENRPEDLPRYASLAKAYATDTIVRVGLDSIILHGAVGYTVDYDIQLYFKRSKWARPVFGDAAAHYERVMSLRGV